MLKEIVSDEQKALLVLSCFSMATKKHNMDKDIMGYLVSIFISKFRATTDKMEFVAEMLAVLDEINKINDFFRAGIEHQGNEWLSKQLKQETPFGKNIGITERLLVLHFYTAELKAVNEFVQSFLKNFNIVNM
ncbi:MAG: hypothetical protein AAB497_02825 [Patescibacteria group bacterium]